MNWADYLILIIIAMSVLISFLRGFVKEAISLVVWVLAIIIAIRCSGFFTHLLVPVIQSASVRYIIVFVTLFLLVLIIGVFISVFAGEWMSRSGLGFVDRLVGIVFGTARGILLVGILLMFVNLTSSQENTWVEESQLIPYFKTWVSWLNDFLPDKVKAMAHWAGTQAHPIEDEEREPE
ncbi:MAG TPA: CvpA family protein [Coxiellaceae bacterium]|nr:CvpA family protein [Coxiellaceae bacterium]